jgi:glycosyltransferase involved in cell wall biosynthesis
MRVTHIITRLVVGGAQENTLATISGLRRQGVEIELISGPALGPEGSLEAEAREIPNHFTLVPQLVRPVHPLKDFLALRKLERILADQKPDLVHTHSGKAGILGRLAARRAGVPAIIHHIHGPSFGNFQGALANFFFTAAERRAGRVTDHFFCSASAMTRLYLRARIGRPEQYTRIFSGFNLQPFLQAANDPALRRSLGLNQDHFVIGKIGRLFHLKGHADAIAAFACLAPRVPQARLLLVGDGILRRELENQVREQGLTGKVIFTGLVPPADVPRYLGLIDSVMHLS